MKNLILLLLVITTILAHRTIPEYEINLDLPIEERYAKLFADYENDARTALDYIFNTKLKNIKYLLRFLAKMRGPEEPEMQEEINHFA